MQFIVLRPLVPGFAFFQTLFDLLPPAGYARCVQKKYPFLGWGAVLNGNSVKGGKGGVGTPATPPLAGRFQGSPPTQRTVFPASGKMGQTFPSAPLGQKIPPGPPRGPPSRFRRGFGLGVFSFILYTFRHEAPENDLPPFPPPGEVYLPPSKVPTYLFMYL